MEEKIFLSITKQELEELIIACVKKCLKEQKPTQVKTKRHLLTIQQACELLHLKRPTIYGLVSDKKIPVSKRNKRLYFDEFELLEWIKNGKKNILEEPKER